MMLPSVHELIKPPMLPLDPAYPVPSLVPAPQTVQFKSIPPLTLLSPGQATALDYFYGPHGPQQRLNSVYALFGLVPFLTPQPPNAHRVVLPITLTALVPSPAGLVFPQQPPPMTPMSYVASSTQPPPGPLEPGQVMMYNPYMPQVLPAFAHFPLEYPEKRKVIKRRTRTGCLTCRKRRIKCDERKPKCHNCERLKKVCLGYEQPGGRLSGKRKSKELEKMAVENLLV